MFHHAGRLGFALEPLGEVLVAGVLAKENLARDLALDDLVARAVHSCHRAFTDALDDLIAIDDLSDHRIVEIVDELLPIEGTMLDIGGVRGATARTAAQGHSRTLHQALV